MADMTPDEVLAQLKTRGFDKGFQRTPLREFKGKLESITGSMEQRGNSPQARLYVLYNYADVEVIQSTEPYPFPVAQLEIPHSNRDRSLMGVFGASVDKIINAGADENAAQDQVKGQDYLVGKTLHNKMTPGHMMWDASKGEETPRDCWELVGIEGEGSTPATATAQPTGTGAVASNTQKALDILDGKTLQQWHQEVFSAIKGDTELSQNIINGEFLPPLEALGMVTKDENGIYHVKRD